MARSEVACRLGARHIVDVLLTMSHGLQLDEQAFKDSTVGLVTRDKFLHMKNTIQERREEEAAQAKREAEQQQEQVSQRPSASRTWKLIRTQ